MAENFDMPFFEISCKNDVNVEAVFLTLTRMIKERTSQNVNQFYLYFVLLIFKCEDLILIFMFNHF